MVGQGVADDALRAKEMEGTDLLRAYGMANGRCR
jgi:hypothetical protein